jgi:hypothetical protein
MSINQFYDCKNIISIAYKKMGQYCIQENGSVLYTRKWVSIVYKKMGQCYIQENESVLYTRKWVCIVYKKMGQYCIQSAIMYSETCIKGLPWGLRKHGFLRQVAS